METGSKVRTCPPAVDRQGVAVDIMTTIGFTRRSGGGGLAFGAS
jgi:hypothetical protein